MKEDFLQAVKNRDIKKVQELISGGMHIITTDELFEAVEQGDVQKAKQLFEQGIDIKIRIDLYNGLDMNDLQKVHQALNQGCNVDIKDKLNKSPLCFAAKMRYLELAEYLIMRGTNVNFHNGREFPLLFSAAGAKDNVKIVELLLRHKAEINSQHITGYTALHSAASFNNFEVVKLLLENGADYNLLTYADRLKAVDYTSDPAIEKLFADRIEFDICEKEKKNAPKQ